MSVIKANGAGSGASGFYKGVATQSLRFEDGSSTYLTKTFGSDGTGSGATCTISCWVKRANISNNDQWFFTAGASSPAWLLGFRTADTLVFGDDDGNPKVTVTDRVFRDTSAWYHIVLTVKTSESDNANKYKIYVNGELQATTFSGTAADTLFGANVVHNIGRYPTGSTYVDLYMSELNFVDGLALDASYFGETKNGVWIPKEPDVSEYGTNGFRFKFDQVGVGTASTSTIGADSSGKTNHFTSSGIVASDCAMPDSPENNFPTLSSLAKIVHNAPGDLSDGNLKFTLQNANVQSTFTFNSTQTGKYYWEYLYVSSTDSNHYQAVTLPKGHHYIRNAFSGSTTTDGGIALYFNDGTTYREGSNAAGTGGQIGADNIIQVKLDLDNQTVQFGVNNSYITALDLPASSGGWVAGGIQSAGTGGTRVLIMNYGSDSSFVGEKTAQGNSDANGIGDFYYAVPSGFLAVCTANLPEPTIGPNSDTQMTDHHTTLLHTADGSAGAFTGADFQPDWIWAKNRTNTYSHELWDSIRGINSDLQSDNVNAEITDTGRLVSFDSGGFSYGTSSNLYVNNTASVAWLWKANGGTNTTNDASATSIGSIDSVIQANTTAGFSIVTYTGNGTNNSDITIAHGLGVTPRMVIVKNRTDGTRWQVYHEDLSADGSYTKKNIVLNSTSAESGYSSQIKAVSSTTFTVRDADANGNANVNKNNSNYVAYCFAEVEGYSNMGIYFGNGSTNGPFIHTGFAPKFILLKIKTGTADGWWIVDDKQANPYPNPNVQMIVANTNAANNTSVSPFADILSNGFKLRSTWAGINTANSAYIYMAFGETFKYANAR